MWDVYGADGRPTGRVKARGEDCLPGEYRCAASLWLVSPTGELLIQRRSEQKHYSPGKWSITGGAMQAGESSAECCLREVGEEIGLVLEPEEISLLKRSVIGSIIFDDYIAVRDFNIEDAVLQREEVAELRWVTAAEIRALYAEGEFAFDDLSELDLVEKYISENL